VIDALNRFAARDAATETLVFAAVPSDAPLLQEAQAALKRALNLLEAAKAPGETLQCEERAAAAYGEVERLKGEITTVAFTLTGIGPTNVEALVREHPPTKQQVQEALKQGGGNPQARPQWNEDTFPQALLAQAITRIEYSDDPGGATTEITPDAMASLWASKALTVADRSKLFLTALSLDQRGSSIEDLGKG